MEKLEQLICSWLQAYNKFLEEKEHKFNLLYI